MNNIKYTGEWQCECGKIFKNSQSFNGHKTHCKVHQLAKYGNLDKMLANEKRFHEVGLAAYLANSNERNKKREEDEQVKLEQWINEKHVCEHCGKVMIDKYGSGRFCCQSCANSHIITDEQKKNISSTLKNGYEEGKYIYKKGLTLSEYKLAYVTNPKYCSDCGKPLDWDNRYKNYCIECREKRRHERNVRAGIASANKQAEIRRSKNEIYFCELCENYFNEVKHNEPMFNGWDADVIIEDIKYAILWNGKWHYEKITKKHSVKQVQNRDKIKLNEIIKAGYTPYIIKDMGSENKKFVKDQFDLFIKNLDL